MDQQRSQASLKNNSVGANIGPKKFIRQAGKKTFFYWKSLSFTVCILTKFGQIATVHTLIIVKTHVFHVSCIFWPWNTYRVKVKAR